jgi:hypothetical protein
MSDNAHTHLNTSLRTKSDTFNITWIETTELCDFSGRSAIYKEIDNNLGYKMFSAMLIQNIVDNIK